ncbi:MAG: hypothetical protein EZS28_039906 [Streblomastix strix]|uniref:Uncharacterized protein n=1 Tax=Streblomastix strix TaxID=222440 RepID=A0A5J4U4H8_9EUKA|nr:MAG: hypothetical protein EZS28_039906 [Streblomastix strix]
MIIDTESIADQDRQYSNGIQREKMERQGGSATVDEEAEDASNGVRVDNLNGAHSGAAEHDNRHLELDEDQRGLQIGSRGIEESMHSTGHMANNRRLQLMYYSHIL